MALIRYIKYQRCAIMDKNKIATNNSKTKLSRQVIFVPQFGGRILSLLLYFAVVFKTQIELKDQNEIKNKYG